jgi:ankyrin repeat protein
LWVAAAANLLSTAKFLLEMEPMNKHLDVSGIIVASYCGHLEMVQLLAHSGTDVNTQADTTQGGEWGPALVAASFGGHENIVRLLLNHNADVNAQGQRYQSALVAAVSCGREKYR